MLSEADGYPASHSDLRVSQIIAALDNEAAGPSYSVRRLAEALAARGAVVDILCTGNAATKPNAAVPVHAFPQNGATVPLFKKLYVSQGLRRGVGCAAAAHAVLHSHGLWTLPNLYPAWAARRYGAVHVISPRGMLGLAALDFSRRQKQLVWWLAARRAIQSAACLHATSRQEYEELRSLGLRNAVAIVPNGVDLPDAMELNAGKMYRDPHARTLLHLGRVHPKKGIFRLIEAWSRVEPRFPDWHLLVVGPSENGHAEELIARAAELGCVRVKFENAIFGALKNVAYQKADLFVLPTLNENFGMVVAESLANGTPVICTKGAPWSRLDEVGAGWWIDHGVDSLEACLNRTLACVWVSKFRIFR